MEADITTQAVGLASNTDFSLWKLFLRADFIVKSVILILIACSIYSWAIIVEKIKLFKKIHLSTEQFEKNFWKSKSAETFYNSLPEKTEDPMANVFKNSMKTLLKSKRFSNKFSNIDYIFRVCCRLCHFFPLIKIFSVHFKLISTN